MGTRDGAVAEGRCWWDDGASAASLFMKYRVLSVQLLRQQILDGLSDLHELLQAGRFDNELIHAQAVERLPVEQGFRREPNANGDSTEMQIGRASCRERV